MIGQSMMSDSGRRFQPTVDHLDGRRLLSGGVSAILVHRVLSVQGTSASTPIRVDIQGGRVAARSVVVEGVGPFRASQIRLIQINGVEGQAVAVSQPRRGKIPVTVSGIGAAT